MTPLRWLHITTLLAGPAADFSPDQLQQMSQTAADLLADTPAAAVTAGQVRYHPEAIMLGLTPAETLRAIYDAARSATHRVTGSRHRMVSPRVGGRTSRSATARPASRPSRSLTPSARGCPGATSTYVRSASSSSRAPNGPGIGASSARSALPHQRGPSPAVGVAWSRACPRGRSACLQRRKPCRVASALRHCRQGLGQGGLSMHHEPLMIHCRAASICPAGKCLISAETKCDVKCSATSPMWESVTTATFFMCL